jgi:hypothetical protein
MGRDEWQGTWLRARPDSDDMIAAVTLPTDLEAQVAALEAKTDANVRSVHEHLAEIRDLMVDRLGGPT